jgi:hypothetical protein
VPAKELIDQIDVNVAKPVAERIQCHSVKGRGLS